MREGRSFITPNPGFLAQLERYEITLGIQKPSLPSPAAAQPPAQAPAAGKEAAKAGAGAGAGDTPTSVEVS